MREADFVSLAEMLVRTPPPADDRDAPPPCLASPDSHVDAAAVEACSPALRDVRLFRARLADAFDEASARLLRELAADVLARELRLAPCDLAAIVQRVQRSAPVVVVRVAAHDAAPIADVPVVIDETLQPGDAILEVVGGAVDARLGVRLAQVLEAFA